VGQVARRDEPGRQVDGTGRVDGVGLLDREAVVVDRRREPAFDVDPDRRGVDALVIDGVGPEP